MSKKCKGRVPKDVQLAVHLRDSLAEALAESGVVKVSPKGKITNEDIIEAVTGLATGYLELANKVEALERKEAALIVDDLIRQGRIAESKREVYINLKTTAPYTFEALVPATPIYLSSDHESIT